MRYMTKSVESKNFILIVVGPFGAGKSTVRKKLSESDFSNWRTVTTRPIREAEAILPLEDQPYIFVSVKDFLKDVENGLFLEYREQVAGWYYGKRITEYVNIPNNTYVITESEIWQIADFKDKLQKYSPHIKVISCFLVPETVSPGQSIIDRCVELALLRNPDTEKHILEERALRASRELEQIHLADFKQTNYFNDLDTTIKELLEKFHSKINHSTI